MQSTNTVMRGIVSDWEEVGDRMPTVGVATDPPYIFKTKGVAMLKRIRMTSETLYWTVILVIVIAVLTFGGLAIQRYAYPWYLSIQRKAVEDSKSFTDANNNMLETYILEYSRLDTKIAEVQGDQNLIVAYEAQQKAIVGKMCRQISTMKKDTVNPDTLSWLNKKGSCR